MKKLRQYAPLVIEELTKTQFHQPAHGQTYYEILYIFEGEGIHHINKTGINYQAGNLFLISPEDTHYMEIKFTTHFGVVKFTDSYFTDDQMFESGKWLRNRPDKMMKSKALKEQRLHVPDFYRPQLRSIFDHLMCWKNKESIEKSPIIFFQLLSVYGIIQQIWPAAGVRLHDETMLPQTLILFIHQHIYEPQTIQIKNLARVFHMSESYFGKFFKRQYGVSYREYVNNYRIKLIENRAGNGLTLKEVADEFGFVDESHLWHFVKNHAGKSFRDYRSKLSKQ